MTSFGGPSGSGFSSPDLENPPDSSSPIHKTKSRHVRLVDDTTLRERQWVSVPARPRPTPMIRSPSAYSGRSAYSRAQSSGARTPIDPHSPRASISTFHLQHLLESLEMDQYDTFGVEELRDGFFDATFYRSSTQQGQEEDADEEEDQGLSVSLKRDFEDMVRMQLVDSKFFFTATFGTRDGILLVKAFLAYFISYILCLIPQTQDFLGRYSYWITIAALFNHPGRTVGAQIDGTFGCILGAAIGLGVGSLALQVASSTSASNEGYGGIIAIFLVPMIIIFSWVRCSLLRLYQTCLSAGLSMLFLCMVETAEIRHIKTWERRRVWEFAIPWMVGLGICLVVNVCLYPETGERAVAVALHNAMESALKALVLPRKASLEIHSKMGEQIVSLSDAVRDMRNEITFSALRPDDAEQLRNLLQSVIRHIMAIKPETSLFVREHAEGSKDVTIQIEPSVDVDGISMISSDYQNPLEVVRNVVAAPARELATAATEMLRCCNNELMRITGVDDLLDKREIFDVQQSQNRLREAMAVLDTADESLIGHPELPNSYSSHPELVSLFLFINPLRQSAGVIDVLATKVLQISQDPKSRHRRVFLPSYPFKKALYHTGPQVLHDRGGVSAGYYFHIKGELNQIMGKIHGRAYFPDPLTADVLAGKEGNVDGAGKNTRIGTADENTIRFRVWKTIHRMQQFETRFAIKVVFVTTLLSVPSWLEQCSAWWTTEEAWWAVVSAWFIMHPRVGGNMQDLITRTVATVVGALWGGLAYVAGSKSGDRGAPYVIAAFALVFMPLAVFRFMLSSHPRSGLMSCLSFTIVSIGFTHRNGVPSADIAWARGIALVVGVVAAVVVNWIVWPFIARHELRKSLSHMLLNLGILYRGTVARYIYHDSNYIPSPEDIEISHIQEAKLREHCFRMRELAAMTAHEIRPRGPFDPTFYLEAIDSCERFLEHVVEVRQASLYFEPFLFRGDDDATRNMLSPRRDSVASLLMNLYVLAGSLRSKRPVPRYLPSVAAARKRLVDRMAEVEEEFEEESLVVPRREKTRRWADIYHYAYAAALTDIVDQVELLERLTKSIVGEMALDAPDSSWKL